MANIMITDAVKTEYFDIRYVGADSAFGRDHKFRDSIPKGLVYFVDVPINYKAYHKRPKMIIPKYSGRGRRPYIPRPSVEPLTVKDIINNDEISGYWEEWVVGNGSNGPVKVKDKCVKVVESRNGKPGKDVWLYARKMDDGSIKYALSNESMDATPEMVRKPSLMRWSIEMCFKDGKNELGMDHYQLRSYPGLMRHILFCEIAHLIITKLRILVSESSTLPELAPIVLSPVTIEEYKEASKEYFSNTPIQNPKIKSCPTDLWSILTIGLIRELIQQFLHKSKDYVKNDIFRAMQNYNAKRSRCKSFLNDIAQCKT
jgi:hypothetical protein